MCNDDGLWIRIIRAICLFCLVIPVGCRQAPNTNKYFSFLISEIDMPEISDTLIPEQVCDSSWTYQAWYIDDDRGVFLSPIVYADSVFVSVEDITTGAVLGRYCKKGRGPQEFLSPFASDYKDGRLSIYDIMTNRYSEIDIEASIAQGRSLFVRNTTLDSLEEDYLTLFSIHKWKDSLLAYNMGQNPMSQDLTRMPDYTIFNIDNGEKVRDLHLFKNIPLSDKRREIKYVPVKSRMGATDWLGEELNKMCFAMYFIPQLNIVDLSTGKAEGFFLKEKKRTSLLNGYRHYHDITATRDYIFALYYGEKEDTILSGVTQTDLHVFDWAGRFLARYCIPAVANACQVSENGLYVTLFSNNSYKLNLISWDQFSLLQ